MLHSFGLEFPEIALVQSHAHSASRFRVIMDKA